MISLSIVFHWVSAGTLLALIFGLLKIKQQRDVLRSICRLAAPTGLARVQVRTPYLFLKELAQAFDVVFEDAASGQSRGEDQRVPIETKALAEIFLHCGLSLIRCSVTPVNQDPQARQRSRLTFELQLGSMPADGLEASAARISRALGGVLVTLSIAPLRPSRS